MLLCWSGRDNALGIFDTNRNRKYLESLLFGILSTSIRALNGREKDELENYTNRLAVSPLHGHPLLWCEKMGSTKMKIENFFLAPRLVLDNKREEHEPNRFSLTPWQRDFTPIYIVKTDRTLFYRYYKTLNLSQYITESINNIHHVENTATQPQEQTPKGIEWYVPQQDAVTRLIQGTAIL